MKVEQTSKVDEPAGLPPLPAEVEPGPYRHDPTAFPPPATKPLQVAPRLRPSLSASNAEKDSGAVPPFPMPVDKDKLPAVLDAPPPARLTAAPAVQETWPAVLNAPPPPGLAPTIIPNPTDEEPAEITAIRKASTFPFPSPTAKFPPLPGLAPTGDTAAPESVEQESFLKKLLLIGALVILVLGCVVFVSIKFLIKPPAKATAPTVAAAPAKTPLPPSSPATTQTPAKVPVSVETVVTVETAPVPPEPVKPEVALTTPAPTPAVAQEPVAAPEPPPVVVKPPPPQPSLAFKAWVINLRIRGVRGGDAQRVFIDKTSYVPGDVVNQQLGIIFTGYDESTRMLTFQDKTGAVFERRH